MLGCKYPAEIKYGDWDPASSRRKRPELKRKAFGKITLKKKKKNHLNKMATQD